MRGWNYKQVISTLVLLVLSIGIANGNCTVDGGECGLYGYCERKGDGDIYECRCVRFWEGASCDIARPIVDLGVGYLILRVFWIILYSMTSLLLIMQITYRIRTNSIRSNVSNWIYILLLPWSLTRFGYHAFDFTKYNREEDIDIYTFILWMDFFAIDILITGFSLMIVSWMEVVHRDLGSLNRNRRGCINKLIPVLVLSNLLVYGSELSAVIAARIRQQEVILRDIYFITIGIMIITFGIFLCGYGYKILKLLSFTEAAKAETKKMSRMVIGVGICSLIGTFIILFFTITRYDFKPAGWAIYQITGRIAEYTAASFLFWSLRGESFKKSFNWKSWITKDYHSNSSTIGTKTSQTIEMAHSI